MQFIFHKKWLRNIPILNGFKFTLLIIEMNLVQQLSSWEMELVTCVQILNNADCISLHANAFGKGINPSTPPHSRYGYLGRLGSVALVRQQV